LNCSKLQSHIAKLRKRKPFWQSVGSQAVQDICQRMGVCLLVYNLAQRKLRQELESANTTIRNQVKKLTNKPTMRWVFQMFKAVHLVNLNGVGQISNLTKERRDILNYLGKVCGQYYLIVEDG